MGMALNFCGFTGGSMIGKVQRSRLRAGSQTENLLFIPP
jgi:hypothetical protein